MTPLAQALSLPPRPGLTRPFARDRQQRFEDAAGESVCMTTVAVLVDPAEDRAALSPCVEAGVLTESEASDLSGAMARDVCAAVEASGGELLVNYAPLDADGGDVDGDADKEAERAARNIVADGLSDPGKARYEVQVGSTRTARIGNTVTHLLEGEGVQSAAVVDPAAALLERRHVDSAAMKLRGSAVVLGPAPGGRVWYAAFREPIDFTEAFEPPAVRTLTDRARDEGHEVDFLERNPVVETPADLAELVLELRTRQRAEKWVPSHTAAAIEDLGLGVVSDDEGLRVARD